MIGKIEFDEKVISEIREQKLHDLIIYTIQTHINRSEGTQDGHMVKPPLEGRLYVSSNVFVDIITDLIHSISGFREKG